MRKRARRSSKPVKLLKDPIALFSVPWLAKSFNVQPVILIRHPAAFVLSIKEKEWWFDFTNFLEQPNFFNDGLEFLQNEVEVYQSHKESKTIVENAALLWKVCYAQVWVYQKNHPQWYYVTHEDLSVNPEIEFKKIFTYLDLEFNGEVQDYIAKTTKAKSSEQGQFVRDSQKNA